MLVSNEVVRKLSRESVERTDSPAILAKHAGKEGAEKHPGAGPPKKKGPAKGTILDPGFADGLGSF